MSTWENPGGPGEEPDLRSTPPSHPESGWSPPQAPQGQQPAYGQGGGPGPAMGQHGYGRPPGQYGYGQPGYQQPGPMPGAAPPIPKPGVMWLRPQGVGDILDVAFQAIKGNPAASFGVTILGGLVSLALVAVAIAVTGGLLFRGGLTSDDSGLAVVVVLTALVVAPLTILVNLATTAALVHVFAQAVLGRRASIGEAIRAGGRRMWSLLGAGLMLAVAYTVGFVVMMLLFVALHEAGVPTWVVVLLAIVVTLVVIFFSIRLVFVAHVVVMETAGPWTSVQRSVRLTRRRMWRTFGIMLLAWMVVSIVSSVVQMMSNGVATLLFGATADGTDSGSSGVSTAAVVGIFLFTGVLSLLVSAVTQPFLTNVLGGLYLDARIRDEGLAAALTAATVPANPTPPAGSYTGGWNTQPPHGYGP